MNTMQQQQMTGQFMTYGFIVLIFIIIILVFYFGKGKKISKMTNPQYFNEVMKRELVKQLEQDDTLVHSLGFVWRNSLNTKFHNYYIGLTNNKLILIKVKSYFGAFTDTENNIVVVNHQYKDIKNLEIKEDTITEQIDKIWLTSDIKLIKFRIDDKTITLKIKYKDVFDKEQNLNQFEKFLKQKILINKDL